MVIDMDDKEEDILELFNLVKKQAEEIKFLMSLVNFTNNKIIELQGKITNLEADNIYDSNSYSPSSYSV